MTQTYSIKPGIHSHNSSRYLPEAPPPPGGVSYIRVLFLLVGLGCLGYYGFTLADQKIYQVYGNWAFDQQIAGHPAATFRDYVREQTPFGFLAGSRETVTPQPATIPNAAATVPTEGSVLGRVTIDRLHLSAVVRQGVDDRTLREAVGHVPTTAMPGDEGNFAIAAHRDTLFRALKDIEKGDLVTFQSPNGTFSYQVAATKIVYPTDVSVLHPDGGGLIANLGQKAPPKILTMITCYPFYFVGSAPKRFVVEAQLVAAK